MSRRETVCGPDCRYRSLYEGTQSSLTDIASKQAEALGRVGRLRNGMISILKQKYPRRFAISEQNAGCRFNHMDDEYILGYFEQILEITSELKLNTLRTALIELGVNLPETDNVELWSFAIGEFRSNLEKNKGKKGVDPKMDAITSISISTPTMLPTSKSLGVKEESEQKKENIVTNLLPIEDLTIPPLAPWLDGILSKDENITFEEVNFDFSDLFSDDKVNISNSKTTVVETAGTTIDKVVPNPLERNLVQTVSIRPELFPSKAKTSPGRKRTGKSLRTAATPPDLPQGENSNIPLSDEMRVKLMASVCIPRPMFTSDLISLVGSEISVSAWESECLERREQEVRFVNPKKRHAQRGSLVLPHGYLRDAATEFTKSAWGECMQRYRSTVLYELAVFISHRGGEIVTHSYSEEIANFRLNQSRGFVGVIFNLEDKVKEATIEILCNEIQGMMSEKLSLIIILTPYAENLEFIVKGVSEECKRRELIPVMPVVVAKSWEYALDKGSSAILVAGA